MESGAEGRQEESSGSALSDSCGLLRNRRVRRSSSSGGLRMNRRGGCFFLGDTAFFRCASSRRRRLGLFAGSEGGTGGGGGVWSAATARTRTRTRWRELGSDRGSGVRVRAWNAMAGGAIGGGDRRPRGSGWGFAGELEEEEDKRRRNLSCPFRDRWLDP